ncbi:hypothetical protein [Polyangium jinanense]|uniref:Uncharacterized protein n=1 Tax=Polyangium jinanense TaxID=2829994 RepID=A0A9X3XI78_9BACT|nr:hypothetical protein [Polyangium jinanense]MDC3961938.1 hypothetical protein [Polyangium jinanense]MDC3988661.1 hypothetical protein [Polyangium jinanense]
MQLFSSAPARRGLGVLLGAVGLQGSLGCNSITGVDALRFEACAPRFTGLTSTDEHGGPGGSPFLDECPEGEVLVGLRSGMNGPFVSGIMALCGTVRASETHPYTMTLAPGTTVPIMRGSASTTGPEMCPPDTMVVGFEGTTGPFGDNEVLWSLRLHCAPLLARGTPEAPSLSLGEGTRTESFGGAEDQGEAFDPTYCPANQVARAILGRSGALVDAFGLGCAEPSLACPASRAASEE